MVPQSTRHTARHSKVRNQENLRKTYARKPYGRRPFPPGPSAGRSLLSHGPSRESSTRRAPPLTLRKPGWLTRAKARQGLVNGSPGTCGRPGQASSRRRPALTRTYLLALPNANKASGPNYTVPTADCATASTKRRAPQRQGKLPRFQGVFGENTLLPPRFHTLTPQPRPYPPWKLLEGQWGAVPQGNA